MKKENKKLLNNNLKETKLSVEYSVYETLNRQHFGDGGKNNFSIIPPFNENELNAFSWKVIDQLTENSLFKEVS